MKATYDLVRLRTYLVERKVIEAGMNEEDMRRHAKVWGFRKARVDKLVNHTSKKYISIDCKGYSIIKNFH